MDSSVWIRAVQLWGRKMCTWERECRIQVFISVSCCRVIPPASILVGILLVAFSFSFGRDEWIRASIRAVMTSAKRFTWRWPRGSRIRIAALWPPIGTEQRVGGRMASAVMRWMRDVLPAGEGCHFGGGERSSRIGKLVFGLARGSGFAAVVVLAVLVVFAVFVGAWCCCRSRDAIKSSRAGMPK
jgi:hypothetical protein